MDPLDKVHIVRHDLQIVSFVNLTFVLETLLQREHRVIQELLLIFIFTLNVLIDLSVFLLLILDEAE